MSLSNSKGLLGNVGPDSIVREFIASEAITAGDWVSYDVVGKTGSDRTRYVVQGTATLTCTAGVALEAASAAGQVIRVCVRGYCEGAKTDGNVAIHNALIAGAAGAAIPDADASVLRHIGYALETDSGTTCDVFVTCQ